MTPESLAELHRLRERTDEFHWIWNGRFDDTSRLTPTPLVTTRVDGRTRQVSACRVAWEEAYGPIPPDHTVMNGCGARGCTEPDHLVCLPFGDEFNGPAVSWTMAAREGRRHRGLVLAEELHGHDKDRPA